MTKMIGAAEFKTHCLRILREMQTTGEAVMVTHRGKPMITLQAASQEKKPLLFGAMKGSVLKYERPFDPAVDPEEWEAVRGVWEPEE